MRKTKVVECQEAVAEAKEALAKYEAANPELPAQIEALAKAAEKAEAVKEGVELNTTVVEHTARVRLRLRTPNSTLVADGADGNGGLNSHFHPDLLAAIEKACGCTFEEGEELRRGGTRHGLNPFMEALLSVERQTMDKDPLVQAARRDHRKACDEAWEARRLANAIKREGDRLRYALRTAQSNLEQAEYERDERMRDREERAQKGSYAAKDAARRQHASDARAKLAQVAAGELKVTW